MTCAHFICSLLGGETQRSSETSDERLSLFFSFQLERGDFLSEEWRERIANTRYGACGQCWGLAGQAAFLMAQLDGGGSQVFPSVPVCLPYLLLMVILSTVSRSGTGPRASVAWKGGLPSRLVPELNSCCVCTWMLCPMPTPHAASLAWWQVSCCCTICNEHEQAGPSWKLPSPLPRPHHAFTGRSACRILGQEAVPEPSWLQQAPYPEGLAHDLDGY